MSDLISIEDAYIGTSGNTFFLRFHETSTGKPAFPQGVGSGNVTLLVKPEGDPVGFTITLPLSKAMWRNQFCNVIWWPLNFQNVDIIDDVDVRSTRIDGTGATSGWVSVARGDVSPDIYLGTGWSSAVRGSSHSTGQKHVCTFAAPAGEYKIYTNTVAHASDSPATTLDIQFDTFDGSTLVDSRHFNPHAAPFNDLYTRFHWSLVGQAWVTSGTLVVEASDAYFAENRTLSLDAIRIVRIAHPVVPSGATVTFDASDASWVTSFSLIDPYSFALTPGLTVGAITAQPVTLKTDETLYPVDLTAEHTFNPSYNLGGADWNRPSPWHANRYRQSPGWSLYYGGGFWADRPNKTLSEVSEGTFVYAEITNTLSNGVDPGCYPLATAGPWRIYYTYGGGEPNFILGCWDQSGAVVTPSDPVDSTMPITGVPCRLKVFTVTPPAADDDNIDKRRYFTTLRLFVLGGAGGSTIGEDIGIFGPEIPDDWDSLYHPSLFRLLHGKGYKSLRFLNCFGQWARNNTKFSELPTGYRLYPDQDTIIPFTIASIGPADLNEAKKYWGFQPESGGNPGESIVTMTTASPHGLSSYQQVDLQLGGSTFPDTGTAGGFVTFSVGYSQYIIVLDDHTFLCQMASYATSNTSPGGNSLPTTVTGTTLNPGTGSMTLGTGMELETVIGLCNELQIDPYLNLQVIGESGYYTGIGAQLAAGLDPERKVRLAYGNEVWNTGGNPCTRRLAMKARYRQWLWDHGDHVNGIDDGTPQGSYRKVHARESWQNIWEPIEAQFVLAGRPASDVIRVIETQIGGNDLTSSSCAQLQLDGKTFHELAPSSYVANDSAWKPYHVADGGVVDYNTAYYALDQEGLSDLWHVNIKYSGQDVFYLRQQRALETYGFTSVTMITYEGSFDIPCLYGFDATDRCFADMYDPRMGRINQYRMEFLQDCLSDYSGTTPPAPGITIEHYFTLNGADGAPSNLWHQHLNTDSVIGRGDGELEPDGVTRLNDNRLNRFDLSKVVSPIAWASEHWASGENPMPTYLVDLTPSPTPTPTPTFVRRRFGGFGGFWPLVGP